ncbi:MAG: DUF5320 domain-containing protein [Candidatus Bipolaricaulota bacterium]
MPRGDGTGPAGMGPITGRGLGYCAGYATPGFTKGAPRGGGGYGRGRGFGRGYRPFYGRYASRPPAYGYGGVPPTASPAGAYGNAGYEETDELTALQEEAEVLEDQLERIRGRIAELEEKSE